MASVEGDTVRKKRTIGFAQPPYTEEQVQAHRILWDAQLEALHKKQGPNSQIFTAEKLNQIISTLENYETMTWPVKYSFMMLLHDRPVFTVLQL